MGTSPLPSMNEEMEKDTEPARSPSLERLKGLMSSLTSGGKPADTSWHDQMVQHANQVAADQQQKDRTAAPVNSSQGGRPQMSTEKEKWAADAFKKSHKGRLHRALNEPEDKPIPEDKMRAALAGHHGLEVQRMAQAAHNINE